MSVATPTGQRPEEVVDVRGRSASDDIVRDIQEASEWRGPLCTSYEQAGEMVAVEREEAREPREFGGLLIRSPRAAEAEAGVWSGRLTMFGSYSVDALWRDPGAIASDDSLSNQPVVSALPAASLSPRPPFVRSTPVS